MRGYHEPFPPRRRRALPPAVVDALLCVGIGVLAGVWLCWLGGMA